MSNYNVEVFHVTTEDEIDSALQRIGEFVCEPVVVQGGDKLNYIPWETEHGDMYAGRPTTVDEYAKSKGKKQFVHLWLEDIKLPWTVVIAIPERPDMI